MKKILVFLAVVCCITACEKDNNSSRYDDLISSFDLSQMDQTQFVQALTTEVLCFNDADAYVEGFGWGCDRLGVVYGWRGILCAPDGTSNYFRISPPFIGPIEAPKVICICGQWTFDSHTSMFTIDASQDYKIEAKVVYYKYPRLILDGMLGHHGRFRWDCFFSKEDPQALLDSCDSFVDANK